MAGPTRWCKTCDEPLAGPFLADPVHAGTGEHLGADGHPPVVSREDPVLRRQAEQLEREYPEFEVSAVVRWFRADWRREHVRRGTIRAHIEGDTIGQMREQLSRATGTTPLRAWLRAHPEAAVHLEAGHYVGTYPLARGRLLYTQPATEAEALAVIEPLPARAAACDQIEGDFPGWLAGVKPDGTWYALPAGLGGTGELTAPDVDGLRAALAAETEVAQ